MSDNIVTNSIVDLGSAAVGFGSSAYGLVNKATNTILGDGQGNSDILGDVVYAIREKLPLMAVGFVIGNHVGIKRIDNHHQKAFGSPVTPKLKSGKTGYKPYFIM